MGEGYILLITLFDFFIFESIICIYLLSLFQNQKERHFPLIVDEYEPDTYNSLEHRVRQHFTEGGNKLVNIKLSDVDQVLIIL